MDCVLAQQPAPWGGGPFVLSPYLGQVATRSYVPNVQSGTLINANSRTAHVAAQAITSLQVKFPAWFSGGIDTNASGSLTYTASIEYPAGTFTQVTWSASASAVVAVGGVDTGLSDAAAVAIPKGAVFWVRNFCKTTGGTATGMPFTQATTSTKWAAQGEACASSTTTLGDQTMSGTVTDGGTGIFIYPLCIVATTTAAAVCAIGDSRTIGTGMSPDANGCQGQVTPSLGSAVAWIDAGVGGSQLSQFNTSGRYRAALAQYCSHVINGYLINDIRAAGGNRTAAQAQADLGTFAKQFAGKTIFGCTISPSTSSTDAWTTTANQTNDANAAALTTVNTYILGVPSPYKAVLDIASVTNDGATPTKWKVDAGPVAITNDGLHCNSTGYSDIVASGIINPATIAATPPVAQWSLLSLAVSKPVLWLDFNNIAVAPASGTGVLSAGGPYTWSGSANPTYAATGWQSTQAAYTFNGTSQALLGDATFAKPFSNGLAGTTIAMMITLTSTPASSRTMIAHTVNGSNSERAGITVDSAGKLGLIFRRLDADAATTAVAGSGIATATPTLLVAVFDPAGAGNATLFVNGVQVAQGNFLSSGNFSATSSNNVALCTLSALFTAITARELSMFDSALNTTNRQKLEGDMAWRAGVAASVLPAGHPYLNAAPTS